MRSINETFIAGEDIPIVDAIKKADKTTAFDGSGYEITGSAVDVTDDAEVLFTWDGTIDSSGNLDASIPAASTLSHGGKTIKIEVWCSSGPKAFVTHRGFIRLETRVAE